MLNPTSLPFHYESILAWTEHGSRHELPWRRENLLKPPQTLQAVSGSLNAKAAAALLNEKTALLWRGDYHQARQLLAALKKQLAPKPAAQAFSAADFPAAFHRHRLRQGQLSQKLHWLMLEVSPDYRIAARRAPEVQAALEEVYGKADGQGFLLSLPALLGFIGAHEWHKRGLAIPALGAGRLHVPFGVFSPLRGEYIDLVARAPLPEPCHSAFDIGTGSGILAALLARRGIACVTATDNNPRALAAAAANLERLGLAASVHLQAQNLFPEGRADLIVCNPPWLPAKATSAVETAVYDPDFAMLEAFLGGVRAHLNRNGQAWLVMSDLAVWLGLAAPEHLSARFARHGLTVIERHDCRPVHPKAADPADPLSWARARETTSLYRLQAA